MSERAQVDLLLCSFFSDFLFSIFDLYMGGLIFSLFYWAVIVGKKRDYQ